MKPTPLSLLVVPKPEDLDGNTIDELLGALISPVTPDNWKEIIIENLKHRFVALNKRITILEDEIRSNVYSKGD